MGQKNKTETRFAKTIQTMGLSSILQTADSAQGRHSVSKSGSSSKILRKARLPLFLLIIASIIAGGGYFAVKTISNSNLADLPKSASKQGQSWLNSVSSGNEWQTTRATKAQHVTKSSAHKAKSASLHKKSGKKSKAAKKHGGMKQRFAKGHKKHGKIAHAKGHKKSKVVGKAKKAQKSKVTHKRKPTNVKLASSHR